MTEKFLYNIKYLNSNSTNSKSSISNSSSSNQSINYCLRNSAFSNIFNQIIFILSETEIPKYFEDKKNIIQKCFNEKDPKYEGFFLILDAFTDIKKENPDIQSFNMHINDLIKIYEIEKENGENNICDNKYENNTELKNINRFIIFNLLIQNFIKVIAKEKKKKNIKIEIKNGETEEKVIQNYKNIIENLNKDELLAIKYFNDLLLNKMLLQVSSNEYKMSNKILFHIVEPTTLDDYFKNKKIYSFSKYVIFLYEIKDNNYQIKYQKDISLPIYDGSKNNFFLYAIIYKEDLEYIGLVKNPIGEKNWKKFNNKSIEYINLSKECAYERPNPIILIYKKIG